MPRVDAFLAGLHSHIVPRCDAEEPEEGDDGPVSSRNLIQPLNQARGRAAFQRTAEGFFDADGNSNAHVRVQLRTDAAL